MVLPRTPSWRLDGKRALITGGTRGIGLGAAVALAETGAEVTVVARRANDVASVVAELKQSGFRARGLALDVTDRIAVRSFVAAEPAYDVLVNSAGGARQAPFLDVTDADYDAIMELNVSATFFVSQAVARRMVAEEIRGAIIHISSQMGHVAGPKRTVYAASKHALEGLTKAMAIELGPHQIRVNTICPTFIETSMSTASLNDPAFRQWALAKIKMGRLGTVEDIMGAVVYLASDASTLVTGTALMVDGGWTAE